MPDDRPEKDSPLLKSGRFGALGLEFGVTVAAGVIVGYYLDRWTALEPLFTLLFAIGALAGALYRLMWMLKRFG